MDSECFGALRRLSTELHGVFIGISKHFMGVSDGSRRALRRSKLITLQDPMTSKHAR